MSTRRGAERVSRCTSPVVAVSTRLRHFLFTSLKTQGIGDALIQPYSGHASRQSLDEIYSRVALADAQQAYDQTIGRFPV